MRFFYVLKFTEIALTLIPLITIFLTNEICSPFISNKAIVHHTLNNKTCTLLMNHVGQQKLASSVHISAIMDSEETNQGEDKSKTRMGKFFGEVLRSWDSLWGYEESQSSGTTKRKDGASTSKISSPHTSTSNNNGLKNLPTSAAVSVSEEPAEKEKHKTDAEIDKNSPPVVTILVTTPQRISHDSSEMLGFKQCAKVELEDYFGQGDHMDSVSEVLQGFSTPIIFLVCYLLFSLFHCTSREPLPYGCCALMLALAGLAGWTFVMFRMYSMDRDWYSSWAHSNLRPELMDLIAVGELISPSMIVFIMIELCFEKLLMSHICISDYSQVRRVNSRSWVEEY